MYVETYKEEITLKELVLKVKEWFNYFVSKWKIIILMVVLGSLLGICYSLYKKPTYTATLTFALEDEKGGGSALNLASQFGLDLGSKGGNVFTGENLIQLFKSRAMIEAALLLPVKHKNKNISLAEMYIINNDLREGWQNNQKLKNIQFLPKANRNLFSREQDSILASISNTLVEPTLIIEQRLKKTTILDIKVLSDHEVFAKTFAECLVSMVSDYYVETKTLKAKRNLDILQKQTDSVRGMLNGNIVSVAVANDNTFGLNPAMNVKRVPSARKNVDVQVNTAILTELIKQTELAKVTLRKETPLLLVIDHPIYPLEKKRFGKLMGIIIGGTIAGIITLIWFILKKILKGII